MMEDAARDQSLPCDLPCKDDAFSVTMVTMVLRMMQNDSAKVHATFSIVLTSSVCRRTCVVMAVLVVKTQPNESLGM